MASLEAKKTAIHPLLGWLYVGNSMVPKPGHRGFHGWTSSQAERKYRGLFSAEPKGWWKKLLAKTRFYKEKKATKITHTTWPGEMHSMPAMEDGGKQT